MQENGIVPHIQGNTNNIRDKRKIISFEKSEMVYNFLNNLVLMRRILLPGRIPDFKDIGCYALPIGML